MNNDKEKKLWDDVDKEVIQLYPNKNINFITKPALIIFKKIKKHHRLPLKIKKKKKIYSKKKENKKKNKLKRIFYFIKFY